MNRPSQELPAPCVPARRPAHSGAFPITCLLLLLAAPAAYAAWPGSGLPLATGPLPQLQPVGLTAPGGDLLAFWVEGGSAPYPLRAQRVTPAGTLAAGWPAGGRGVVAPPAYMTRANVAPDGAGGVLIAWYDYRATGGPRGIYGVRVDLEAAVVPGWNPGGTPICTLFNAEGWGPLDQLIGVCADGAGGAYVAWTDARNTPPMGTLLYDVFAQHLLGDGTPDPAWPAQGRALTTGAGYKYPHALLADDAGGFWLATENPLATHQLRVTHHASDGTVIGTWVSPSYASHPQAVSDDAGGILVTWHDCAGCPASPDGISVLRLAPGALPPAGWPAGGTRVTSSPYDDAAPTIAAAGNGAAVVAWLTSAGGGFDWYAAQRVEADGVLTPGWPADGRIFATSTSSLAGRALIVPDGTGGAMFAFRRNLPNLFGSRVTAAGTIPAAFPDTGLSLCTVSGDQFLVSLVSDGANGAYVLWEDRRDDPPNSSDVYVTRFTRDGVVGATTGVSDPPLAPRISLSLPAPNPARGSCAFRLSVPAPTRVQVEVLDVTGRRIAVLLDGDAAAGVVDLRWDGRDGDGRPLRSGVYLLRARAGREVAVRPIALLE